MTLAWVEDFLLERTFAVRVQDSVSSHFNATSGVPRGSVLGPLLFLIFIDDLTQLFASPCLAYADDLKIWRVIRSSADQDGLQEDLNRLVSWARDWSLPLNLDKCPYVCVGRDADGGAYNLGGWFLKQSNNERDLGILVSHNLKTPANTDKSCANARRLLGAIRRSFWALKPKTFSRLFASHVRPVLEYGGSAEYPCTKKEKNAIERVQRAGTKMVHGLYFTPY